MLLMPLSQLALLATALHMVVAISTVHVSQDLLKQCLNNNQPPVEVNTWENAMSDRMAAVKVAEAWWSATPPAVPMTIITQLSLDRLGQLKAQVRSGTLFEKKLEGYMS